MKIIDGCISCGMCDDVCSLGAIKDIESSGKSYKLKYIDQDICINCGDCLGACPGECIKD